jgi:hypothetical protein
VIYLAIAKDASERFTSADEFAASLRRFEQNLHYMDGTEAILNALPSAPDADALLNGSFPSNRQAPSTASQRLKRTNLASTAGISQSPISGSVSGYGGGHVLPGTIYCIDCGMQNKADSDFCVRCMRPLISRDMLSDMVNQQAKRMYKIGRGDYVFLSCLSLVMVAVVLLIIFLFFKGTT